MKSNVIIKCDVPEDVLLTIAIPTYKRFDLLKETLRSVFSLEFTIPIEVIVVDNDPDSISLTLSEMNEFSNEEFTYYKNIENYGMFDNWNQCLKLGQGKLITILHDDDLLCSNFPYELESFLKNNNTDNNISLIGFGHHLLEQREVEDKVARNVIYNISKTIFNLSRRCVEEEKVVSITLNKLFWGNIFSGTLGVVMDRKKALSISGFDKNMYPVSDYDFWVRWVQKYGPIKYNKTKVSYYRVLNNESMRPEVISDFINKNYALRLRIIKDNPQLINQKNNAIYLKKLDTFSFNIAWSKGRNYKLGLFGTINYIYLKLRCSVFRK
ncbi:glycosyltransferase family 2 protein [Yersinia mollaretii]|uniref:glycosyltransferase family 2 protein n=1 Tax=Yersinia mollaretii TaxID=33060 RepID=UPI0011A391DA|nr:glycosyltransferase family 2 protein [Yersinia mollaretii]